MSDEASEEWDRIAPELYRLGLLTVLDTTTLAAYCQCYRRWVRAERLLERGLTVKGRKHPAATIAKECLQLMRGYIAEFGLGPSARASLGTIKPPKGTGGKGSTLNGNWD